MFRATMTFLLVSALATVGCQPKDTTPAKTDPASMKPTEKKETSQNKPPEIVIPSMATAPLETKDSFQNALTARLNQMDTEVALLREKNKDLQADAKINWDKQMAKLELDRTAAHNLIADVKNSGIGAWKELKKGANKSMDDFEQSIKDASRSF